MTIRARTTAKTGLGRRIVRRLLKEHTGDSVREVVVSIGAPRLHPRGDWECRFAIEGRGDDTIQSGGGVDALQALLNAVEGIRQVLDQTGNQFSWPPNGSENDAFGIGFGIPRQIPLGYGKRFNERVSLVIEREAARFWESRLKMRKANIAEFEAELRQRRRAVAAWEAVLERNKKRAAGIESDLKNQKKARIRKRRAKPPSD